MTILWIAGGFAKSLPDHFAGDALSSAERHPANVAVDKIVAAVNPSGLHFAFLFRLQADLIPPPEQHESAYLLAENALDGGVVFGI
jgi:hypothetical protein